MHGEQRELEALEAADSTRAEPVPAESVAASVEKKEEDDGDEGEEFAFAFVSGDSDIAVADEIFLDGQIRPAYPLLDGDLFRLRSIELIGEEDEKKVVRMPLEKLMSEDERDGEGSPSASSSEADELDSIPAGSYCLWTPGRSTPPASPGMRRKSKSTGSSSLPSKLRDLVVGRSHSDGKHKLAFLAPANTPASRTEPEKKKKEISVAKAHHMYYVKGVTVATPGRRRPSYLPYRRDLVGLFAPMGGPGGGFHP